MSGRVAGIPARVGHKPCSPIVITKAELTKLRAYCAIKDGRPVGVSRMGRPAGHHGNNAFGVVLKALRAARAERTGLAELSAQQVRALLARLEAPVIAGQPARRPQKVRVAMTLGYMP